MINLPGLTGSTTDASTTAFGPVNYAPVNIGSGSATASQLPGLTASMQRNPWFLLGGLALVGVAIYLFFRR